MPLNRLQLVAQPPASNTQPWLPSEQIFSGADSAEDNVVPGIDIINHFLSQRPRQLPIYGDPPLAGSPVMSSNHTELRDEHEWPFSAGEATTAWDPDSLSDSFLELEWETYYNPSYTVQSAPLDQVQPNDLFHGPQAQDEQGLSAELSVEVVGARSYKISTQESMRDLELGNQGALLR